MLSVVLLTDWVTQQLILHMLMVGHYNLSYNHFFIGAGKERDQNLHLL